MWRFEATGLGFATLSTAHVYEVPLSEFSIVPSYPHTCSAMVGVLHRPLLPSLPTGLEFGVEDVHLQLVGVFCRLMVQGSGARTSRLGCGV